MPWRLRRDYSITADGETFPRTAWLKGASRLTGPQSTHDRADAMTFSSEIAARVYARQHAAKLSFQPEKVEIPARDFDSSVQGRFGDLRAAANG